MEINQCHQVIVNELHVSIVILDLEPNLVCVILNAAYSEYWLNRLEGGSLQVTLAFAVKAAPEPKKGRKSSHNPAKDPKQQV